MEVSFSDIKKKALAAALEMEVYDERIRSSKALHEDAEIACASLTSKIKDKQKSVRDTVSRLHEAVKLSEREDGVRLKVLRSSFGALGGVVDAVRCSIKGVERTTKERMTVMGKIRARCSHAMDGANKLTANIARMQRDVKGCASNITALQSKLKNIKSRVASDVDMLSDAKAALASARETRDAAIEIANDASVQAEQSRSRL